MNIDVSLTSKTQLEVDQKSKADKVGIKSPGLLDVKILLQGCLPTVLKVGLGLPSAVRDFGADLRTSREASRISFLFATKSRLNCWMMSVRKV